MTRIGCKSKLQMTQAFSTWAIWKSFVVKNSNPSGGKLDILLKDPEDDTMYEVEVMLGATDESHIIRTIEYWDLERKRWPQRQHFAVLVAENITRRFFNVIQLFSLSIPIIAIQANIIEANGSKILHFTKILDTYEEPEDEQLISNETHDESWWRAQNRLGPLRLHKLCFGNSFTNIWCGIELQKKPHPDPL